jgi:hypothetical protein
MPKIVLAGRDTRLLNTRAAVLRKVSGDVTCCAGSHALETVKKEMPDLVVLCHSLAEGEAESIADEVRECCKETKVLFVESELGSEFCHENTKFDATCVSKPDQLITRASELLNKVPLNLVQQVVPDKGIALIH